MTPAITTPAAEATRSHKVYSAQEKTEYLALFEQGGMSPADFCREMSLNEATFSLWRRQAREGSGGTESVQFAEVQVSTTTMRTTLFIGHPSAAPRLASLFTLVENCRLRGLAGLHCYGWNDRWRRSEWCYRNPGSPRPSQPQ